jgi:hypothetical protein
LIVFEVEAREEQGQDDAGKRDANAGGCDAEIEREDGERAARGGHGWERKAR